MIRLTLVTEYLRGEAEELDTDDLGEALAEYGHRHFSGGGQNNGPEKWVISFIVENEGSRMGRDEVVKRYRDLHGMEVFRASRDDC